MKYMNRLKRVVAVARRMDARPGLVNLLGWLRIQQVEANVLVNRFDASKIGSGMK